MTTANEIDLDVHDRVRLAAGVSISSDHLRDDMTGRKIAINRSAFDLISQFDGTRTLKDVATAHARRYGVDPERVQADLRGIVTALDRHALLVIRKSLRHRLAPLLLVGQLLMYLRLDWPRQPARRFPPTVQCLIRAAVRSSRWGLVGACITSLCLFGVLLPLVYAERRSIEAVALYASIPLLLYSALILQMIAHEAGHLVALRRMCGTTYYIAVRGIRLSIAHAGAGFAQRRLIAMAGPAAGFASGLAMGGMALAVGRSLTEASIPLLLAAAHIYSLMPWAADGAMLFTGRETMNEEP